MPSKPDIPFTFSFLLLTASLFYCPLGLAIPLRRGASVYSLRVPLGLTPSILGKRVLRRWRSASEDGHSFALISLTVYVVIHSIHRGRDVVSEGFNNTAQWYTGIHQVRPVS
jgi:hypothetical protein